jgi:glycerol-3-phosphate dehydrogenase
LTFSAPKTITTSLDSFAVIGNGSWATALVKIFSDNGNHVDWYVRKEEDLDYIKVPLNNKIIVSGVKGILPNSKMLVGVYLEKKFDIKTEQIVVIAGPCHAEEIAKNRLSFLTLGCSDLDIALSLKSLMSNSYLNISVSKDVTGIEIAAVIKIYMQW